MQLSISYAFPVNLLLMFSFPDTGNISCLIKKKGGGDKDLVPSVYFAYFGPRGPSKTDLQIKLKQTLNVQFHFKAFMQWSTS